MNNNDNNECPKDREFKTPVGWLAGRELLAALKRIAAYSLMGDKLDSKDWMFAEPINLERKDKDSKEPYWFDYIADTGDGMKAVYTIACLCMSDLWVGNEAKPGSEGVSMTKNNAFAQQLPRGEFLFIGGDAAYHIADTVSLRERFQTPFNWAFDDLTEAGVKVARHPIYGIPANHDYYDALDGFNRQFLKPITQENINLKDNEEQPRLTLKGFTRSQTASYILLKLPFNWQLWGFDSQNGNMDKRQWAFFASAIHKSLLKQDRIFEKNSDELLDLLKKHAPSKLIVATPEPSTVFGKWAGTDAAIVTTFKSLGLEPSFLEDSHGVLEPGKCRLDISGDIHHYERYWGSVPGDAKPVNYASVVAGGGGAFLHPSHTDLGEVQRKTQYPSRKDSHNLATQEVLNPLSIFRGGYLWLVGAIVALLSYFAVTVPESTWSLFGLMPNDLRPGSSAGGLLAQIQAALDITVITEANQCCSSAFWGHVLVILPIIGLLIYLIFQVEVYFNPPKNESPPHKYLDQVNRLLSMIKCEPINEWRYRVLAFSLTIALAGLIPLLLLINWPRNHVPASFLAGTLIDLFVITALLSFGLSRRYSDILIKRAKVEHETWYDRIPLWLLGIAGGVYFGFGFLRYGVYPSSVMTFDLLIGIVWFLCSFGLIALAVIGGGTLFISNWKKRIPELAKLAAAGCWHGFLQLTVPVCLLLYANGSAVITISVAGLVATFIAGRVVFTSNYLVKDMSFADQKKIGNWLFATWGIFGIGLLLAAGFGWGSPQPLTWARLLLAPFLGAWFSCIWFGWYLAVSLAFNGHNNEAGGGARSERFRHMIRFKLTENTLTGYVIGVKEPTDCFSKKPPEIALVDVFTINQRGQVD